MRKLIGVLLIVGVISGILLATGCQTEETDQATVPAPQDENAVRTASDLAVELTYPQSDDQGNYVAVTEPGEVMVSGVVSGPEPPKVIEVNGTRVQPYEVEHITPYGETTQYPVYRFRAPVVMQPDDDIVVMARDPYDNVEYAFAPDTGATISRWTTLADNDPVLASRLGSAYYANNAYEDAVTHLSRAADREDSPWALYDLGMTYLAMERADDAVNTFNRVEPVYGTMPDLYYGRGLTYSTMNRFDDAIADFVRSSDLAPNWAEPLVALGLTHYAQDKLTDSANDYDRAIGVWPDWAVPYYGLAEVRLDQGRVDDALPLLREAEQIGPWRERHHEALARKLAAKGNYVAARRQLEIAQKLGGEREDWWGEVYDKTPNYDQYDGWPWQPRAEDDGYRIPKGSPWYDENRPKHPGRGAGGPPEGVGRGQGQGGGPPEGVGRGQGQGGGPPEGVGGGQGHGGGPPAGVGGGQGQGGGPPEGVGGGQGRGGGPPENVGRGQGQGGGPPSGAGGGQGRGGGPPEGVGGGQGQGGGPPAGRGR